MWPAYLLFHIFSHLFYRVASIDNPQGVRQKVFARSAELIHFLYSDYQTNVLGQRESCLFLVVHLIYYSAAWTSRNSAKWNNSNHLCCS